VRDKIAASKHKGLWVGGPVPLGYRTEVVCGGAGLKSDSNKGTPVILVRIQVPQPTAGAAAAGAQGGPRGLRGHPYERHPSYPYRLLWEEAEARVGRQFRSSKSGRRAAARSQVTAANAAHARWEQQGSA
jgi:hypothetical protein